VPAARHARSASPNSSRVDGTRIAHQTGGVFGMPYRQRHGIFDAMKINTLLSNNLQAPRTTERSRATERHAPTFSGVVQSQALAGEPNMGKAQALSAIVDKYNLRNIRYTDLQAMAHELIGTGALKNSEYLDFLPPSSEFAMLDGSRNPEWNTPMDYIGELEQKLAFAVANGGDKQTVQSLQAQIALKLRFDRLTNPISDNGDIHNKGNA
jgi:hypothetical protein